MTTNRVRDLRKKAGLTQRALAQAAKTSQQQIQRIETGQTANVALALRISKALGSDLEFVFPAAQLPLRSLRKRGKAPWQIDERDREYSRLPDPGIDPDALDWRLLLTLRNGADIVLEVSGATSRRLRQLLLDEPQPISLSDFVSGDRTIFLRLSDVVAVQMLDITAQGRQVEREPCTDDQMRLWVTERASPLVYEVWPDEVDLSEATENDDAQLQNFLFLASLPCQSQVLSFEDEDGDEVLVRAGSICMISIPTRAIDVELAEAEHEGRHEDDAAGVERDV